jgi:hypothetical protein
MSFETENFYETSDFMRVSTLFWISISKFITSSQIKVLNPQSKGLVKLMLNSEHGMYYNRLNCVVGHKIHCYS